MERYHKKIAAMIIEPEVQGAGGMLMSPPGYLKGVRRLCSQYSILLIADEVAVGFGRTGRMFACEHEGVMPDIMAVAKGITGGYLPLAATLTTEEVYRAFLGEYREFKTFFHGHTYTGNQLASVAALANLEIFEREKTIAKLQPKISHLKDKLKPFTALSHVGEVRQKGFMVGIELVKDKKTKEPYPLEEKIGIRVTNEARKRGVVIRSLGNVIVLMPPLSISCRELNTLTGVVYESILEVTGD
jgi:adenosylmethionine-8-amino-7-oxononanoate aminotransferase